MNILKGLNLSKKELEQISSGKLTLESVLEKRQSKAEEYAESRSEWIAKVKAATEVRVAEEIAYVSLGFAVHYNPQLSKDIVPDRSKRMTGRFTWYSKAGYYLWNNVWAYVHGSIDGTQIAHPVKADAVTAIEAAVEAYRNRPEGPETVEAVNGFTF